MPFSSFAWRDNRGGGPIQRISVIGGSRKSAHTSDNGSYRRDEPIHRQGGRSTVADVLDQSEVDALLAAVDNGQVSNDAPPQMYSGGKGNGPSQVDVQTYDFKRPERVSKDQMRAL